MESFTINHLNQYLIDNNYENILSEENKITLVNEVELLRNDFLRFCHLHSWYKKLYIEPTTFYFFKFKGKQARYHFINEDLDKDNYHFNFSQSKPSMELIDENNIDEIYETKLGCFLRGNEYGASSEKCGVYGIDIIIYANPNFLEYIHKNYPEHKDRKMSDFEYGSNIDYGSLIGILEWNKYWLTTRNNYLNKKLKKYISTCSTSNYFKL